MRILNGVSVPRIYWTGLIGDFHVMVMDRLGKSLQQVCDARPVRVLSVSETRALGMKCLDLLRGIHAAGIVHGDVKPENFLLGHKPAGGRRPSPRGPPTPSPRAAHSKRRRTRDDGPEDADPLPDAAAAEEEEDNLAVMDLEHALAKYGLYVVDLGLGLHWAKRDAYDGIAGHVPYKQRVDHFSGTVRYSSVNVHVGRYATRRDDLESLLYMLIFLHKGSLPWQGFTGTGKEMLVCRKKGSMAVPDICRGCPEVRARVCVCVWPYVCVCVLVCVAVCVCVS